MDPVSRETLDRHFASLSDDELVRRARGGDLAELAQQSAEAELQSRGISLQTLHGSSDPSATLTAAASIDYTFGTDGFNENFYQTPRAASPAAPNVPLRSRIAHALWWIYTAVFALLTLRWLYVAMLRPSIGVSIIALTSTICSAGLVAWRLQKPLLWRGLWRLMVVGLILLEILFGLGSLIAIAELLKESSRNALIGVAIFLLYLPLIRGLWYYAVRDDDHIW